VHWMGKGDGGQHEHASRACCLSRALWYTFSDLRMNNLFGLTREALLRRNGKLETTPLREVEEDRDD
jgi:hypothetical protein